MISWSHSLPPKEGGKNTLPPNFEFVPQYFSLKRYYKKKSFCHYLSTNKEKYLLNNFFPAFPISCKFFGANFAALLFLASPRMKLCSRVRACVCKQTTRPENSNNKAKTSPNTTAPRIRGHRTDPASKWVSKWSHLYPTTLKRRGNETNARLGMPTRN